jgi:hypothetical protein
LLGNGSVNTSIARQWLSKSRDRDHVTNATIEELLDAVFSVRFVPKIFKEDQLPHESVLSRRLVSAVRKLQGREYCKVSCETDASQRKRKLKSRCPATLVKTQKA